MKNEFSYPCPSCGFLIFSEPPGSYEICSICGWEDDHVQLANPGLRGGANGGSLKEYQDDILNDYPPDIREVGNLKRDPDWRPLTENECEVQDPKKGIGINYFHAACKTETIYYWKSKT
jgi:hypothetical protein